MRLDGSDPSHLRDYWIKACKGNQEEPGNVSQCKLMPAENFSISEVLDMSESEKADRLDRLMSRPKSAFLRVRTQLHSLMIFWERVIHVKDQLDRKGVKFRGNDVMDMQTCLLGLCLLPRRAMIGLPKPGEITPSSSKRGAKRRASPQKSQGSSSETIDHESPNNIRPKKMHRQGKKDRESTDEDEDNESELDDESDDDDGSASETSDEEPPTRAKQQGRAKSRRPRAAGKGKQPEGSRRHHGNRSNRVKADGDDPDSNNKTRVAKLRKC